MVWFGVVHPDFKSWLHKLALLAKLASQATGSLHTWVIYTVTIKLLLHEYIMYTLSFTAKAIRKCFLLGHTQVSVTTI